MIKGVISCFLSSLVMFVLSYFWHGIFFNDLSRLSYPISVYFIAAPIAYILISVLVLFVVRLELFESASSNLLIQGFLSGAICGFFIYIITMVVGVSFSKDMNMQNILVDVVWQIFEQAVGGGVASVVYALFWNTNH